ncbi:MAG: hypothetical protein AB1896_19965 [Thermodesulfobacteriota bacterium]
MTPGNPRTLLDEYLPRYDFGHRHETLVHAPPGRVFSSVKNLDLSESGLVRLLYRLRGLPRAALTLGGMYQIGFLSLGERPDREVVFGLAGRPWERHVGLLRLDRSAFQVFDQPGFVKVAAHFLLEPSGPAVTRLGTETRVLCLGWEARRRFRRYWLGINLGSRLIRREMLRVIKRSAES